MSRHFLILLTLASIFSVKADDCKLKTRDDLPKEYQPLYLNPETLSPVEPEQLSDQSIIVMRAGSTLTLICNGEGNYLLTGGKAITDAVCNKDGEFWIEGRHVSLKTVTCKSPVKPTLKELNIPCGQNARLYETGFEVGDNWLKVLRACFDHLAVSTRYVQHVVHPLVHHGSVQGNKRPVFKEGNQSLYKGLSMSTLYKKSKQKEMMERQLDTDEYMEEKDSFLAKGHLAADADYIYSNYQHATYFFINAAPQWQTINSGNWAVLEKRVRQIAAKRGKVVSVTTGTHGVLKLKDSSGVAQSIYLDMEGARVPVPLYFWKAVVVDSEGIVFIASNNPFDGPPKPPLCKDICPLNGWKFSRDIKLGKIICCSVQGAKKILQFMPNIRAESVLTWR